MGDLSDGSEDGLSISPHDSDLSEEFSSSADDDESSEGESSILSEDISDESSSESEDIELQLGALEHERQKNLEKTEEIRIGEKKTKIKEEVETRKATEEEEIEKGIWVITDIEV